MRLASVMIFLLLVSSAFAQNVSEPPFQVNDVVESTTGAYSGKVGLVTNVDINMVYVRWENSDAAIKVDPGLIRKVNKEWPGSLDVRVKGETVYMPMNSVKQLYNEVIDYYGTGTCEDGVRNQGETGIDCGGPCLLCEVTPADEVQNTQSFRSTRNPISTFGTKTYGTDMADAIPAQSIADSDVNRIASAVRNTNWAQAVTKDLDEVKTGVASTKQAAENTKTTADNLRTRIDTVNSNVNQMGDKIAAIERPLPEIRSRLTTLEGTAATGSYLSVGSLIMVLITLSIIGYLTYTVVALKKELHVVTETTEEDINKLVSYFERMTTKGYSASVVKRELIKQGFTHPQVDLAHKKFENPEVKK